VLAWVKSGFNPRLVGTQDAKPAKKEVVMAMLRRVVPKGEVQHYLSGRFPHLIQFANHQSFYDKGGFSSDQVVKLVEAGAAGIWSDREEPEIIHPMGVADSAGRDRLILNGRYLNLFLEALPFKYEKLRDILGFTKERSFMASWDLKSGYFHVPIHPAFWKYFCFKVGGVVFHFKVLPFGFAQACYVLSKLMQEPIFELRKLGIPMSSYIDDAYTVAATFNRCVRQSSLSALFIGALGAFLGLPKCHLNPEQLPKWLGFLINTLEQDFKVEANKLEKLKEILQEVLNNPGISARRLARLAGKLISAGPAIAPAALCSRTLFQAMKGSIN
jgi:hypothetical protein